MIRRPLLLGGCLNFSICSTAFVAAVAAGALGLHRAGDRAVHHRGRGGRRRYGFGQAVSWTEEVPRYLLIWISFLAAAVGVLNRDHVGFDVLFNALPKPARRVLGVS